MFFTVYTLLPSGRYWERDRIYRTRDRALFEQQWLEYVIGIAARIGVHADRSEVQHLRAGG